MTRTRRLGLPVLVIGLLGIALAQWVAPLAAPPLYDGVVVAEPYRWLVPPPGEHGAPTSASATLRPIGEASPLLALATAEEPPQAQVFGTDGALVLPAGTSSIKVSITPILPASLPNEGHIAGNVYRIAVTNQKGVPITAPASAQVTVVIRGPDGTVGATIERYADGAWKTLKTEETGSAAQYLAVVTDFGVFTLVASGPGGPYPTATASASIPSASSVDRVSSPGSSAAEAASLGSVAPLVSETSRTSPPPNVGEGPPLIPLAGLLLVAAIGAVLAFRLRGRNRRTPYRGAHPRRR